MTLRERRQLCDQRGVVLHGHETTDATDQRYVAIDAEQIARGIATRGRIGEALDRNAVGHDRRLRQVDDAKLDESIAHLAADHRDARGARERGDVKPAQAPVRKARAHVVTCIDERGSAPHRKRRQRRVVVRHVVVRVHDVDAAACAAQRLQHADVERAALVSDEDRHAGRIERGAESAGCLDAEDADRVAGRVLRDREIGDDSLEPAGFQRIDDVQDSNRLAHRPRMRAIATAACGRADSIRRTALHREGACQNHEACGRRPYFARIIDALVRAGAAAAPRRHGRKTRTSLMNNPFGRRAAVRAALQMTGSTYVTYATGLLASVFIARSVGPADFGRYSYLVWLTGILMVVGTNGLTTSAIRFVSESLGRGSIADARNVHGWLKWRQYACLALVVVAYLATAPFFRPSGWNETDLYFIAAIVMISAIAKALFLFGISISKGYGRFDIEAVSSIAVSVLNVVVIVVLATMHASLVAYLILFATSNVLYTLFAWIMMRRGDIIATHGPIEPGLLRRIKQHLGWTIVLTVSSQFSN